MGLFDGSPIFGNDPRVQAMVAEAQQARTGAATSSAALAKAKLESAAQARLLGITDPYTGINYGQQGAPQGQAQPPLMGAPQQPPGGLMGSPPPQTDALGVQGGLAGTAFPQQPPPQSSQPDQTALYNQAFPEQAANMARIAPMMQQLPAAERALALLAPDKWAEARAKNLIEPDDAKLIDTLQQRIAAVGGPTSPQAKPYVSLLTAKTQNLDPAKLAEDIRAHKATEATAAATATAGAVDVQPDPNNPGRFILVNKLKGTANPVGAGAVQLPPMGAPMPTTGMPAGDSAQPGAPQGASAGPQASPVNDFTPQLSPQIQARVSMLPQANQGMVQAILTGRMAPPTGRILADPVMGPLFRQALQVDPSFDEAAWTARNKMVTGMADTKNASMGLRIDSAKKVINHTADLLSNAADRDQSSSAALEYPMNKMVEGLGTGQAKSNLNAFNQSKEGVASEYVNMMTGGQGSEPGRQAVKDNLSENDPLQGTVGSVGTIMNQLHGQIDPLTDQYNGVMKTNVTTDQMLGADAANKLKAIQALAAAAKSGKTVTAAMVKQTLAGQGLLTPGAAGQAATTPGMLPKPQDIVDELRKRGVVK